MLLMKAACPGRCLTARFLEWEERARWAEALRFRFRPHLRKTLNRSPKKKQTSLGIVPEKGPGRRTYIR